MVEQYEKEGVVMKSTREEGDYMNSVFLREKKFCDSREEKKYRLILNVKDLNMHVEYVHFKMDSLESCLNLMEPNCYMASIDLSNAYHSVPMHPNFTKYLKFKIDHQVYKYLVLPQGFRDSPRIFTKIMKPVVAHLRQNGFLSSLYIDDFYLQGSTFSECKENVDYTSAVLRSLGFEISPKSALIPSQKITHLGFVLDSVNMTVALSESKIAHVHDRINSILGKVISVRKLAQVIGTLVACLPAAEYGPLFYRGLEILKIRALKAEYNFERKIRLSEEATSDLYWWQAEGLTSSNKITRDKPCTVIRTDASGFAWGAVMSNGLSTQGMWTDDERKEHINVLELKACMLGVQSLCRELSNCHVRVELDNTTAVAYINNMGGTHSQACNCVTRELLIWCKSRTIWLTACHIAGKDNVTADRYSRKYSVHTEWKLNPKEFKRLCSAFGTPEIDLFAARTNFQLSKYMSLNPDPSAHAINAFFHVWSEYVYIFPPFNLIPRILKKLGEDRTEKALVVVPVWTTQTWYPKLVKMMMGQPVYLEQSITLLTLPSDTEAIHPLLPKLRILGCLLSGKT